MIPKAARRAGEGGEGSRRGDPRSRSHEHDPPERARRRRAPAPSWAVVSRLCWRESAQRRRRACVAVCSGCGPVYARVCACEAHPSRGRQIAVCSSPGPLSPASLNSYHNRLLSARATLRFSLLPYVLLCVSPVSLSDPQQPGTHLADRLGWGPERPRPGVRSFQAGAGGCGSAGRRWRAGTRSVAVPEPEAAPPPRSENRERGGERAESKEEVIVINECHN